VIVDVFYDHFLARNWNTYHVDLLPDFADKAYGIIQSFDPILPKEVKYMMPYMIKGNWLVNYSNTEGIHRALSGMSRRTPYDSKMEQCIEDLKENYTEFSEEFATFLPALKQFAIDYLKHNPEK
jgi:acyl carrier protein phosphodiesterase